MGYLPYLVMAAEWDQKLIEIGRAVRIGMYAVGGSLALITLMWSGIKWLIARSNGDHSHTFIDYLQQLGVVGVVGGTLIFGAWAWGVFGSGTIA
ncbi:type IV secretion system protein VirB2 [Pseudomonas protegens]|uniref:type IV secretion system protein VirB2 n=1 Tax=Pseudomonas protegens TaxID=380021 RepID=UPI00280AFE8E|nr:type IV secretion system protein VirB2 [Pseudomonas protegens]